jgi:hypothetical protein
MSNNIERSGFPLAIGALLLASAVVTAATYVVDANITVVQVDSTANAVAIDLPSAAQFKDRIIVVSLLVDPSAHNATVTPAGSDTVGGASTKALTAAGKFAVVQSDGVSDWKVLIAN